MEVWTELSWLRSFGRDTETYGSTKEGEFHDWLDDQHKFNPPD
jgi:hypothetical protein